MSPFPLLRLPGVVLCELFKSLSIGEKINLSLCSKKSSIQINNDRLYSQRVIVDLVYLGQKIRVHSENEKDTYAIFISPDSWKSNDSNTQQFSIACCSVRGTSFSIGIDTFWKNQQEGFLFNIRHLLKMLQCTISTSVSCYESDLYGPIISELFDLQVEFKAFTILLNKHLLFKQMSSNFGRLENLRIISVANPGFSPVFHSWPQKIRIGSSYWFTVEFLLACTCTHITLEESCLENKDLDEVLKNWMVGGLPNLKYLKIHSLRSTNNGDHILGMDWSELNGMVIQTDDGSKKATIKLTPFWIEMDVIPFE
ncbi:hypothetical protein CRE_05255 [Caenorhabditis remanei]|uniref:F-box domain-containing protein n=1 Tax=Caenorhabditis remanei TaxID=31234 RepID=E3NIE1_CAERE|nr:hypothetical protein CRE_05255 [Caenorhabditis remanei]